MTENVMTDRLYYRDQGLLSFDATVTRAMKRKGVWHTFLDRSAFYPTSGGQLHDTGTLNGVTIIDVIETDGGDVAHLSEEPIGATGEAVKGEIDAERRWQHRQQHTAQHILSAVFLDLYEAATVSVHLGAEYGAVEFDRENFAEDELSRVESEANLMLREDYPVTVSFVNGDKAEGVPFRRPPKRSGELRVVQIGDFEYAACGGTHCDRTAQVGAIKIVGQGKLRGHALVHFLSGPQALTDYRVRFNVTNELSRTLTCGVADLPDKIDGLLMQERELKQQLNGLYARMLPVLAEEIIANNKHERLVAGESELPDGRLTAKLATLVVEKTGRIACLINGTNLVVAAAEGGSVELKIVARALTEATDLKGGGSGTLVQFGKATPRDFDKYLSVVEESIGLG